MSGVLKQVRDEALAHAVEQARIRRIDAVWALAETIYVACSALDPALGALGTGNTPRERIAAHALQCAEDFYAAADAHEEASK